MPDHTLLGMMVGLFLGVNIGVILMAMLSMAKRSEPVEQDMDS